MTNTSGTDGIVRLRAGVGNAEVSMRLLIVATLGGNLTCTVADEWRRCSGSRWRSDRAAARRGPRLAWYGAALSEEVTGLNVHPDLKKWPFVERPLLSVRQTRERASYPRSSEQLACGARIFLVCRARPDQDSRNRSLEHWRQVMRSAARFSEAIETAQRVLQLQSFRITPL